MFGSTILLFFCIQELSNSYSILQLMTMTKQHHGIKYNIQCHTKLTKAYISLSPSSSQIRFKRLMPNGILEGIHNT